MTKRKSINASGTAVIAGVLLMIGMALYPAVIHPKLFPEVYRKKQKKMRENHPLETTQPGGMKVWSDPFGRKE